jgi:hypothetical protein
MVNRVKGGGRVPPSLTINFSIVMECPPESGRCHSVCTGTVLCNFYELVPSHTILKMMVVRFAFAMNVEKHVLLMHTTSASVSSRTKRDAAHRQHSAILCATTPLPCRYSFVPCTFTLD